MTLQHELLTTPNFEQIMALVAVLGGILFIFLGVRMSRRAAPSVWQEAQWLRQVRRMAGGEESHEYDADDLQAVWRQWLRQLGTAVTGAGVGILVGALASFALAQLALRAPFSLPDNLSWFCVVPPMWGMAMGYTCGSLVGARARATVLRHGAVADTLVSRKVLDYRSPLLTVILAIPAIVYTALTILVAPKYTAFDEFDLHMYLAIHGHEIVSPPQWIVAIYPGAMWLTVLLIEVCAWVRVKSAASIVSHDAALARGASMALTGLNVGLIYAPLMMAPIMMGTPTALLLSQAVRALDLDSLVSWALETTLIVGYASYLFVFISAVEGRLGGRLTGWLWTKERTQRVASAEAEG